MLAAATFRALPQHAQRRWASGGGAAPSPTLARMRRYVLIGSVGFGLVTVSPLFWYLGRAAGEGIPEYAKGTRGSWVADADDGRRVLLKINSFGVRHLFKATGHTITSIISGSQMSDTEG